MRVRLYERGSVSAGSGPGFDGGGVGVELCLVLVHRVYRYFCGDMAVYKAGYETRTWPLFISVRFQWNAKFKYDAVLPRRAHSSKLTDPFQHIPFVVPIRGTGTFWEKITHRF